MKGAQSISTRLAYGVQRICRVWGRARSSVYARRHAALVHDSKLTVNDPNPEASHRPLLYDSGRPSSVIWFRT